MLKKISINFLLYAVGPQVPRIFSFLLLPVFTKYLTTADYGVSGIIYSYIGLFSGLSDLGLHIRYSITFFKYNKTYKERWKLLNGILFWWSITFSFVQSFILMLLLPSSIGDTKITIIALNFITNLLFSSWNSLCTRYLQFIEASVLVTLVSITTGILTIILNYVFIVYYRLGFMGWFYSAFIISVIQGVFSVSWLFLYGKLKVQLDIFNRSVLKILFITVPLVLNNYSGYLLDSSDRVVMTIYKIDVSKIGLYNFAYIFAMYFEFITTAVGFATGPMFSRIFFSKEKHRYFHTKDLLIFILILFIILALGISLFIQDFFKLFISNSDLWNCNYMVCVLVFAYSYKPLYWYISSVLSYNNRTGDIWKMTFITGILNVCLNFILIPVIGLYSCVIVTFICMQGMCIIGSLLKNYKRLNEVPFNFMVWIFIITLLLGVSLLLQNTTFLIKAFIYISICGVIFYNLRAFYLKKIKPLQSIYQ